MSWLFLSYTLSENLTGYGNGQKIRIHSNKSICSGDTCNTCSLEIPNHYGTHIDLPRHFSDVGKALDSFEASTFFSNKVQHIKLDAIFTNLKDKILGPEELCKIRFEPQAEILLFNFGFWKLRTTEDYLFANPSLSPETASYLKKVCPGLKMIVMDVISLNSWKNKEVGRKAHHSFLIDNNILIVEDADFSNLLPHMNIKTLIVSPLRFSNADGAPVTIMADVSC